MSRRERVVLVCDVCEKDEDQTEGIATRRVHVDRIDVEAEVCMSCWGGLVKSLLPLSRVGRKPQQQPQRRRQLVVKGGAMSWPDSDWQLTSHAVMRIGERHLDPARVIEVAEHPDVSRPSRDLHEAYVHESSDIKVVVIPHRKVIVTAAARNASGIEREATAALR